MDKHTAMQTSGRIKVADLNTLLSCVLCNGYYVDATTISECLHSFCRTCIVSYLQSNKYCPICEVQVHKTRPLMSIRADQTLQDIVYKVVPGLFKNEMKKRRDFYAQEHVQGKGGAIPVSGEKRGDVMGCERLIFTPEDIISISLEYCPPNIAFPMKLHTENGITSVSSVPDDETLPKQKTHRRYLQCPGGLTVCHLKKLLRAKYSLLPHHSVDVMYMHDQLHDEYTLTDLAYIYSWRRNGPMRLFYKIHEKVHKRMEEVEPDLSRVVHVPLCIVSQPSLPSCPDEPVPSHSVPSVGAAPASQCHIQCHASPPRSPQMAVEPGDIKIANQNCAAMVNGPTDSLRKNTDHHDSLENIVQRSGTYESSTTMSKDRAVHKAALPYLESVPKCAGPTLQNGFLLKKNSQVLSNGFGTKLVPIQPKTNSSFQQDKLIHNYSENKNMKVFYKTRNHINGKKDFPLRSGAFIPKRNCVPVSLLHGDRHSVSFTKISRKEIKTDSAKLLQNDSL